MFICFNIDYISFDLDQSGLQHIPLLCALSKEKDLQAGNRLFPANQTRPDTTNDKRQYHEVKKLSTRTPDGPDRYPERMPKPSRTD